MARRPKPPPCDCPEGYCHNPGCVYLRWRVDQKEQGNCPDCGRRIISERDGQIRYCPKGHFHEMSGEAFLELMDATGSGWIREAVKKEDG